MKPRTTLLLAVVLVLLAGIATLMETNRKRARSAEGESIFPAYSVEKADRVEIDGRDDDVVLARPSGTWVVETEGNHRADREAIDKILDAVAKIQTKEVISRQREKHGTFEVSDSALVLRVSGGGKSLASLFVGKPGPDFMSTYIRPEGKDEVYLAQVYLPSLVQRGDQTWRDKKVFHAEKDAIVAVTTRNSKETVTLEKSADDAWTMKAPVESPVRPEVLSVVLDQLTRINASAFADSAVGRLTEFGLEPDTMSVEIRLEDGTAQKLVVGVTNSRNQSFVIRAGQPDVYLVPKGRWNSIFRPSQNLLPVENAQAAESGSTPAHN